MFRVIVYRILGSISGSILGPPIYDHPTIPYFACRFPFSTKFSSAPGFRVLPTLPLMRSGCF